jgi:hypothetical protein
MLIFKEKNRLSVYYPLKGLAENNKVQKCCGELRPLQHFWTLWIIFFLEFSKLIKILSTWVVWG